MVTLVGGVILQYVPKQWGKVYFLSIFLTLMTILMFCCCSDIVYKVIFSKILPYYYFIAILHTFQPSKGQFCHQIVRSIYGLMESLYEYMLLIYIGTQKESASPLFRDLLQYVDFQYNLKLTTLFGDNSSIYKDIVTIIYPDCQVK